MKMTIYLVRHGIAEDRVEFSSKELPDSERPLTILGRKKTTAISKWLGDKISKTIDLVAESPLLRSKQTLDILVQDISAHHRLELEELLPEVHPRELLRKLLTLNIQSVLLVGHEPHLSAFLSYIVGIKSETINPFQFKKGGVACVQFTKFDGTCNATLLWQVTPKLILN